jgi:hypothetical protein
MMRAKFFQLLILTSWLSNGCVASDPDGVREVAGEFEKVMSVNNVEVVAMQSHPEQVVIKADGTVRTGGWTDPKLVPSAEPVRDGIYHFDFVARKPEGMVTQALTKISVSHNLGAKPENFRGVEIHAETNSKSAKF